MLRSFGENSYYQKESRGHDILSMSATEKCGFLSQPFTVEGALYLEPLGVGGISTAYLNCSLSMKP